MQRIREWGFPVVLIVIWMLVTAYTISLTIEPSRRPEPPAQSHAAGPRVS